MFKRYDTSDCLIVTSGNKRSVYIQTNHPADIFDYTCLCLFVPKKIHAKLDCFRSSVLFHGPARVYVMVVDPHKAGGRFSLLYFGFAGDVQQDNSSNEKKCSIAHILVFYGSLALFNDICRAGYFCNHLSAISNLQKYQGK
jgi:hypothetical protein